MSRLIFKNCIYLFYLFIFNYFTLRQIAADAKTYFQELYLFIYQKAEYIKINFQDIFICLFAFLFFCLQ